MRHYFEHKHRKGQQEKEVHVIKFDLTVLQKAPLETMKTNVMLLYLALVLTAYASEEAILFDFNNFKKENDLWQRQTDLWKQQVQIF